MKRKSTSYQIKSLNTHVRSEKEIQRDILAYLAMRKDVFAWQNDSVGIFDTKKQIFRKRVGILGTSDILGIYKGRFLAIEVKSAKGRLSEHQKTFLENVKLHGGIAIVARSIEDVISAISF